MKVKPLVSIICTTFNHEKFVKRTLDGFLSQQTNFSFEIIVHDDASTDGTVEILKEYEQNYPSLFRNIYRTENWYSRGKNIWKYLFNEIAKGKYIAICEGDDYWTDNYKLQKQVDYLETHTDCGLVFGRARCYIDSKRSFSKRTIGSQVTSTKELLANNTIPTLTVLLRMDICKKYVDDYGISQQRWMLGDYPLWLYVSMYSKIHFVDEIFAVYRVLSDSASHAVNIEKREDFINSVFDMKSYFAQRYRLQSLELVEKQRNESLLSNAIVYKNKAKVAAYYKKMINPTWKVRLRYWLFKIGV